ncbi:hypothetical protein E3N88_37112 [Mikania micrantha]|uniref:Uncharacterized protein n=1 Tax=Mikania micrantha TaxID=192012 RepID=A0A5N6M655_9ASTR|nr:hypothetical protein E3N88_37112 [Mikania micrantha]
MGKKSEDRERKESEIPTVATRDLPWNLQSAASGSNSTNSRLGNAILGGDWNDPVPRFGTADSERGTRPVERFL